MKWPWQKEPRFQDAVEFQRAQLERVKPWRVGPIRRPTEFADPRIDGLPTQDLRELVEELFGHVRQLQSTLKGVENAHLDVMARLQEVVYREGSTYAAWTKAAKAMAEVTPPNEDMR